jgi:hypothetical protein
MVNQPDAWAKEFGAIIIGANCYPSDMSPEFLKEK